MFACISFLVSLQPGRPEDVEAAFAKILERSGSIATPMSTDTPKELKDAWMPLIPQHRMGNPEELIPPILYLATAASGYTTGSDVIVDGGYSCL